MTLARIVFVPALIFACLALAVVLLGGCSIAWEDGGGMDVQGVMGCPVPNPCENPDPEVPDANVPEDNAR